MFAMFLKKPWKEAAKKIALSDEVIELKIQKIYEDTYNGHRVQNYLYKIILKATNSQVGFCDLRIGDPQALYYLGDIGYNIFRHARGQGLATRATLLLCELAKELGQSEVYITCNPDNIASIKTIERARFKRIAANQPVPVDEPLFRQGDFYKNRYVKTVRSR